MTATALGNRLFCRPAWLRSGTILAVAGLGCSSLDTRVCHGAACDERQSCQATGSCAGALGVFRSVGPGAVAPLATGENNALTIAHGSASFTASLPDSVGVGDAIVYSTDGSLDPDHIAFISVRTSNREFGVQARDGSGASETRVPDTLWSIFRAYTSLADAVTGGANQGLPVTLADFDVWPNGNDLVAANQTWNIACYADSLDVLDGSAVIIRGWNTGPTNYLRIFTPSLTTEAGADQRHHGAYDATKYALVRSNNGGNHLIDVFANFVRMEGLQILDSASNSSDADVNVELYAAGDVRVESNIVLGNSSNAQPGSGIVIAGTGQGSLKLWNNVVAGFSGPCVFDNTTPGTQVSAYLYNNTLYDCARGIDDRFAPVLAENDIIDGIPTSGSCVADQGVFAVLSDYNTCNLAEAMRGSHSWSSVSVSFVDPGASDFHLATADSVAHAHGNDLSNDPAIPFHDDIDGDERTGAWDIGADQR